MNNTLPNNQTDIARVAYTVTWSVEELKSLQRIISHVPPDGPVSKMQFERLLITTLHIATNLQKLAAELCAAGVDNDG